MNDILTFEPLYLAPISFYQNIVHQNIALTTNAIYTKKTLKNRTYILGVNGILRLSIPLQHQQNERRSTIQGSMTTNSIHYTRPVI